MLRRAKRLRLFFDQFCLEKNTSYLMLDQEQWRQVDYLLWITDPFFKYTTALSRTKDVTIHLVFTIYNQLFDHLEKSINQLSKKRVSWKKLMLTALEAAREKLDEYYSQTYDSHGDIFAIATILHPQKKLTFFTTREWAQGKNDPMPWDKRYRQCLQRYFEIYQNRQLDAQADDLYENGSDHESFDNIEYLVESSVVGDLQQNDQDEISRYLNTGLSLIIQLNKSYY
jgi:hypothetical protein